jgi:hypothetical protein
MWSEGADWIKLAKDGDKRRAFMNVVMNFGFNKSRIISWAAERLSVSEEYL